MKVKVFILISLLSNSMQGQTIIEEEFNGGTTPSAGWTFNNIVSTLTAVGLYGKSSPAINMTATGDWVQSPVFVAGTANSISFWCLSSGSTNTNPIVVEYNVGGVWTACTGSPFTGLQTTARTVTMTFPLTATQLRITYTRTTANNAGIDDVTIYKNASTCSASNFLLLNSITFNSCNSNTCEGTDEFLSFKNGNSALNISDLEIDYPTSGASTTYCGNSATPCDAFFKTNAAYVALLNGVASCSSSNFLSPPGGIIPANAKVLVFGGSPPSTTVNFGTLCASGAVYYCVFGSNTTDCVGKYSNNATTVRYTTIRNRATGCSVERSFIPSGGNNTDGDMVIFDAVGASTFVSNASCAGFVILPIELLDFYATKNGKGNDVTWVVAQEENILYYTIEKSNDAINFTEFATVYANNEMHTKSYSVFDNEPYNDITYYRLSTKENNDVTKKYEIISVDEKDNKWEYIHYQTENNLVLEFKNSLPKSSMVSLYDINGKELMTQPIKQTQTMLNVETLAAGVYFVQLSTPYKTEHFKIIITK